MLVTNESADRADSQDAYFDGSLELLRELAVTTDVEPALPRLSAIVSKMLPHDALRIAFFDQRGRLIVNASTADVPDMTASEVEDVIIDDLGAGRLAHPPPAPRSGWSATNTARPWACRPARRSPWCPSRSGPSGPWPSIARTCRSRAGSRTTWALVRRAASSEKRPTAGRGAPAAARRGRAAWSRPSAGRPAGRR